MQNHKAVVIALILLAAILGILVLFVWSKEQVIAERIEMLASRMEVLANQIESLGSMPKSKQQIEAAEKEALALKEQVALEKTRIKEARGQIQLLGSGVGIVVLALGALLAKSLFMSPELRENTSDKKLS